MWRLGFDLAGQGNTHCCQQGFDLDIGLKRKEVFLPSSKSYED
jgi:hypothetical protein